MKLLGGFCVFVGLFAALAASLPFSGANDDQVWVGLGQLNVLLQALYVLPYAVIALGVMLFRARGTKLGQWLFACGVSGMMLASWSASQALVQIETMVLPLKEMHSASAYVAAGPILSFMAYATITAVGVLAWGRKHG